MIKAPVVIWLAMAIALAAAAFGVFSGRAPIQSNLLALLPDTERNPIVEQASSRLSAASERRTIALIGASTRTAAKELARRTEGALTSSGAFRDVRVTFPPPDPSVLRDFYLPFRFHVLSDSDRAELAGAQGESTLSARLQRRLHGPFRGARGVSLDVDPLGLLDDYLASLPLARFGAELEFDDGYLLATDDTQTYALVLGQLSGSPHDPDIQQRLATAWHAAAQAWGELGRDVSVVRAGVVYHASAAREAAERDINRIAVVSVLGIVVLMLFVFRSPRPLALGLISVATGIVAAATATIGAFGAIHIITLVFGASLIGEAIDYSIQYYAARLDAGKTWEPGRGLRDIFPGITIAVVTSILGYSALAVAPFPALRQIALFAVVGLAAAYLTVLLLLPALTRSPARRRPELILRGAAALLTLSMPLRRARVRGVAFGLLALLAIPGWARLTADDDIRLLVNPAPSLAAEEAAVRRLTGFSPSGQFFVVDGRDPQNLLEREERLTARLRASMKAGELTYYQSVSDFVPSDRWQAESHALWAERVFAAEAGLRRLLLKSGFRSDVVRRYIAQFEASGAARLRVDDWLKTPPSAPFRHLWLGAVGDRYASVVMPIGFGSVAVLERAADGLPGVELVDKAGDVSRLFRGYRQSGVMLLIAATLLVFGVLCWRYRWRAALLAMVPTAAGIGLTLAFSGYAGGPLTLFNVMALLLVLGVGVNYVIFLHEGAARRAAVLVGVLLSAFTTLLSFGLLAWSSTPALSQFGSTLFVGIIITVLLSLLFGSWVEEGAREDNNGA